MEWNDPADVALVTEAFRVWAKAVMGKDRATVESLHEAGFRVRLGDRLLDRDEHILLELAVKNSQMDTLAIDATRRIGEVLLVWSRRLMKVEETPEIPSLGLFGDWGNIEVLRKGFVQGEFSVWRQDGNRIRCMAFDIGSFAINPPPANAGAAP